MISIRTLGAEDLDRFIAAREPSYPIPAIDRDLYRRLMSSRLPHTRGLFVEDQLACVATVYPTNMYFAGSVVPMGALAGVATVPDQRRRGYVRRLLLEELARMREERVGWCLEYPFDPRFYARLGWQSVPSGIELEVPSEFLLEGKPPRAERLPLEEFASVAAVYDEWAARYHFTLHRRDDPREAWKRLVSDWWLDGPGYLYRLEDAYVLFTLTREGDRSILTLEDYAYRQPEARARLFAFLGSFHGQVNTVRLFLPADDPLTLDHAAKHAHARRWPLQARIVELGSALAPLRSEVPVTLSLRLRDDQCEWNDGTFRIEAGPEGTSVRPVSEGADVDLPVTTLPLLLAGAVSARAALAQGLAAGDAEVLAALASLGGGRTPFLPSSDAF